MSASVGVTSRQSSNNNEGRGNANSANDDIVVVKGCTISEVNGTYRMDFELSQSLQREDCYAARKPHFGRKGFWNGNETVVSHLCLG